MFDKVLKDYSLGLVLFIFFVISWVGQWIFQWQEFAQTQQEHNQPVEVSAFIPEFLSATMENWQSEFLQLFTMVVLTSKLNFKGSPESKDSETKTEAALGRIETKVDRKKTAGRRRR